MPQNDSPQHTSEPRVEQRELEHANSTSDLSNLQLTSRVPDEDDTLMTAMSDPSVSMTPQNITMTNLLQQMNQIITKPNYNSENAARFGDNALQLPPEMSVPKTKTPKPQTSEDSGTKATGSGDAPKNDSEVIEAGFSPLVIAAEVPSESPHTTNLKEKLIRKGERLKIVDNPRCFSAVDRETITLYCNFEGDVSSYEWLQDGKKIRNTADFKQYCTDDGFACLTIDDVLYLEDSGMYTCQLEGPDGSIISCNILLDVRKGVKAPVHRKKNRRMSTSDLNRMLTGIKGPPEFLIALPYQYDVIDGDEVTFKCKIEGSEPMTVEWLHPGGSPVPNNDDFRQDCQSTSTGDAKWVSLVLPDVFEEDAGLWSCKATNKYGIAKTKTLLNVSPLTAPHEQTTNTSNENLKNFDPEPFAFVTLPAIRRFSTPEASNITFTDREPLKTVETPQIIEPRETDPNEPEDTDPDLDAVSVVSIDDKDSETCVPFAMVTIRKTMNPNRGPGVIFSNVPPWVNEQPVGEVKKQAARRTQSVNPSDLTSMGTSSALTERTSKDYEGPRTVKDLEGIPFAKVKIVNQLTPNGETQGPDNSEGLERSTSSIQVGSSSTVTDSELSETDDSSAEDSYMPQVRTQASLRLNLAKAENEDLTIASPNAKTATGIISRDIATKSKISPEYLKPERGHQNLQLESRRTTNFPEKSSRYEIIEYLQSLPDSYFEEGKLSLNEICRAFQENRFSSPYRTSTSPIPEEQATFERSETSADVVEFTNTTEISQNNKSLKVSSNSIECLGQVISITDENKQTFPANRVKTKQGNHIFSNSDLTNDAPKLATETETQQTSAAESGERKPKSKLTRSRSNTVTSTESVNSAAKPTATTRARTKSPGKIPTLAIRRKTPVKHHEKQRSALRSDTPTSKPESSGSLTESKTPGKTGTQSSKSNSSTKKTAPKLTRSLTRSPATSLHTGELTVDICNTQTATKSPTSPKLPLSKEKSSPKSPNTRNSSTRSREDPLPTNNLSKAKKFESKEIAATPNTTSKIIALPKKPDPSNIMDNIGLLMKSEGNHDCMDVKTSPRDNKNTRSDLQKEPQPNESRDTALILDSSKTELLKELMNDNTKDRYMKDPVFRFDSRRKTKTRAKFERAQTLTHSIPAESVSPEDSYQDEAPYVLGNSSVHRQAPYGEAMQLNCILMGKPTPDIAWFKDGRPVNSSRRKPAVKGNKQQLDIESTIHADAGTYECKGTNKMGECVVKFLVQIVDEFNFSADPPSLYTTLVQNNRDGQPNIPDSNSNDDQMGEELFTKFSKTPKFLSKRDSYDNFEALDRKIEKRDEEQLMKLPMQQTDTETATDSTPDKVQLPSFSPSSLDEKHEVLEPSEFRSMLKNKIKPPAPTLLISNGKQNDMRGKLKPVVNEEEMEGTNTSQPIETNSFRDALHTHVTYSSPSKPTKKTIPTAHSTAKEGLKNKVPLKVEGDKKFESKKMEYRQQLQPATSSIEAKKQISKLREKPEKQQVNKPLNPVRRKSELDAPKQAQTPNTLLEARVGLRRASVTPVESKNATSKIPQIKKRSQQN